MKDKVIAFLLMSTILCAASVGALLHETSAQDEIGLGVTLKSSRVLVVIDIDWYSDPQSYVESSSWAFHDIVTLLKLWSIPFDVLRLDNNLLNITEFIDVEGKPKYGVIIWNCRQDRFGSTSALGTRDWSVLETAVADYGISLIALANTILEPHIQGLLGINYVDMSNSICWYDTNDSFLITRDHFLTRGYNGTAIDSVPMGEQGSHVRFDAAKATVLGSQGLWPQLAVRDLNESTKAVWIGGNRDMVFSSSPIMAKILRNAIVYCIGYSLYKTYPDTVLLRLDDMGSSQSAYLSSWLYGQLSQEQIRNSLVQPLLAHNAALAVMYLTGYPRHIEKTVLKSWTVDWVDVHGTRQNLTSNYLGILEGMSEGVLEIESHGWTHVDPDLVSPPGPWWNNPGGTEWDNTAWYREFYDARRGMEIDAATQNLHFDNSINYTLEAFDTFPLSFSAPADSVSGTSGPGFPDNYTYRLAALEGFGFASDGAGYYYLGPKGDIVISNMRMTRTYQLGSVSSIRGRLKEGGGWDIPVVAYFHDRDVALNPSYLNTFLTALGAPATPTEDAVQKYISNDEFVGYLHARTDALQTSFGFSFGYDTHYCKYFGDHASKWILQFSDDLLQKVTSLGRLDVMIDGTYNTTVVASESFKEIQDLTVPGGTGIHTIQFVPTTHISPIHTAISLSTFSSSKFVGFKIDINGTLADDQQNGISNAIVVVSITFQGISKWLPLTSATTDMQGGYHVTWIPPTTGYFTLNAEWPGNGSYLGAEKNTTLDVISFDENYIFSVTSNSTITALTFNSTSLELGFTASGPSGTSGFSQATIAKTLVANPTAIKAYLDLNQIGYSLGSTEDSWVIYTTYTHSTHHIVISLSSTAGILPGPLPVVIVLFVVVAVLLLAVLTRRKLWLGNRKRARWMNNVEM